MKKLFHSPPLRLLLLCLFSWAGVQQARASHAQAGELTYFSLGNNQYRVRVTFFKDCSGIAAPASFALTARNTCSGGTSLSATLLPPAGFPTSPSSYTSYQPYCGSVQAMQPNCTPGSTSPANALANTVSINYEGVVTLPPAAEWILGVEESARPTLTNINGTTLRLEATLNNLITPVGGVPAVTIQNNSPQFNQQSLPVPFVCWKQSSTISFSATDADRLNFAFPGAPGRGDSLVYSLDRPLNGCGSYETYTTYPGTGCVTGIDPRCGSRIVRCTGIAANYSATLPISVTNDTIFTGPCTPGVTTYADVRPRFIFNAQAGSFRFTPNRFLNTASANGDNKYAVVGKVTEYRKINGRYYKVGSVRRDFLVIVIDCGTNIVPLPPPGIAPDSALSTPGITSTFDTLSLRVKSCNYTRIIIPFTDPDNIITPAHPTSANQLLTVFPPVDINTNLLQNGDIGSFVLTRNGTTAPVGTFYFQPSKSAEGSTVLITIRIEDNACPAKGIQYRTVLVRVIPGQQAKAQAGSGGVGIAPLPAPNTDPKAATICPGGSFDLNGSVIRPDSVRNVATGRTVAQQYRLDWQPVSGTTLGTPVATATGANRTLNAHVSPTVTTRYRLTIAPQLGFAPGCGDTTSFLVRVAPEPIAKITLADTLQNQVCAGARVTLQGSASRNDNNRDTYTYHWQPGNGLAVADTASQSVTVIAPATPGPYTYTLTAKGQTQFGCDATTTRTINVVQPPTISARVVPATAGAAPLPQTIICAGNTAALQVIATPPPGFSDNYTFMFAPANGLQPADQNSASPIVHPDSTTRYRVTATGQSRFGCADTASVLVRVLPVAVASFVTADSVGISGQRTNRPPVIFTFHSNTRIIGRSQGADISYTWTYKRIKDITGAAVTDTEKPFPTNANTAAPGPLRLNESGSYLIRLVTQVSIINPATGTRVTCDVSTKEQIVVVPDVEVANIITPNGDGLNDVFKISTANTTSKLEIYNRWGRKVKEYANYQNNWDAADEGPGVYYYYITEKNGTKTKGWVEVIK